MDSLKEFLDTKYTDYDLVENEEGTFIILADNTKVPLYFERDKTSLGAYYDSEEGCVLEVLIDRD